jgi:hypothetical protein
VTTDPSRFVEPALGPVRGPAVTFALRVSERPLVRLGDRVARGSPIIERFTETFLVEAPTHIRLDRTAPGEEVDLVDLPRGGRIGRHQVRPTDRARLLFVGPDGLARILVGRGVAMVESPVPGIVDAVSAGRLTLLAEGVGIPGRVGWGRPVHGRLVLGVSSPDADLPASAIDIGMAGSVLVAGARLDIEALTRARAIGVAGIICGGVVGRELRQLEESDVRQRAALHAASPFAVLMLDGYGRRPIPTLAWDLLAWGAGRPIGLVPDARLAILAADPGDDLPAPRPAGSVRITAGDGIGRVGVILGLAGPRRQPGGLYQPGGFIQEVGAVGASEVRIVPLADLERLA